MTAANQLLLLSGLPGWVLLPAAAVAWACWIGLHRLRLRPRGLEGPPGRSRLPAHAGRAVVLALRVGVGFVGTWLAFELLGRVVLLGTNWPLWPVALGGAALAEGTIALYALERKVVSRRMGAALTALRLALVGLVVLMLLQPVLASARSQTRKRTLAVLLDVSASMRIPDRQLPAHAKLRLAEAFSLRCARRPYRLEENAAALRHLRERLLPELGWLERLSAADGKAARAELVRRRADLHAALSDAQESLTDQIRAVEGVLKEVTTPGQRLRAALLDVKATLSGAVRPRLLDAAAWTHEEQRGALPGRLNRLRDALRRAATGLAKAAPVLERAGRDLDDAMYDRLGPEDRAAVDALAALPRRVLAEAVLVHRPVRPDGDESGESLLDRLSRQYDVKVWTFAGSLAEVDPRGWKDPVSMVLAGGDAATRPASGMTPAGGAEPEVSRTDLGGALRKVLAAGNDLAGVVVLTDGRDNGRVKPESPARQLGAQGAALCAVAVGGEKPPTDAAVVAIEAPETVYLTDKMFINVQLKLDGLAGKNVRVTLYDGDRPVDFKTIRVAGDTHPTGRRAQEGGPALLSRGGRAHGGRGIHRQQLLRPGDVRHR